MPITDRYSIVTCVMSEMHYARDKTRSVTPVMHNGRDKIIADVRLKLALIDLLTQLKVLKLLTPQLTFDVSKYVRL